MSFRQLKPIKAFIKDIRLRLLVTLLVPLLQVLLKVYGFQKTLLLVKRISIFTCQPIDAGFIAQYGERSIMARYCRVMSSRYLLGQCLAKSLCLYFLLERKAIHAALVFGHRKESTGKFDAHAWLEYKGVPINDAADVRQRYVCFEQKMNG